MIAVTSMIDKFLAIRKWLVNGMACISMLQTQAALMRGREDHCPALKESFG
jgi:hypothetical protein